MVNGPEHRTTAPPSAGRSRTSGALTESPALVKHSPATQARRRGLIPGLAGMTGDEPGQFPAVGPQQITPGRVGSGINRLEVAGDDPGSGGRDRPVVGVG